jgi:yjeF N-terminal region
MIDDVKALLSVERYGRLIAATGMPCQGQVWRMKVDKSDLGAALAASARWADRWGAEVQISFTPRSLENPLIRLMADVCEKMHLKKDLNGPFTILKNHLEISSPNRRRTIESLQNSDSAWAIDIEEDEAITFVRVADTGDPVLTCEQSREVDRVAINEYGLPGMCLMENAGCGAVLVANDMLKKARTQGNPLIVAGGGNNAGDGFVMARGFSRLGYVPTIAMVKPHSRLTGDAEINFRLLADEESVKVVDVSENPEHLDDLFHGTSLIVDAMLGTGFRGEVADIYRRAINTINSSRIQVLSLDLPSGLSGDTGLADKSTVRASRTVTFANLKTGLLLADGPERSGVIYIAEIGAPKELMLDN